MATIVRPPSMEALPVRSCSSMWCLPPACCSAIISRRVTPHSPAAYNNNARRRQWHDRVWPQSMHQLPGVCSRAGTGRQQPPSISNSSDFNSSSSSSSIPASCIQHKSTGTITRRHIQCAAAAAAADSGGQGNAGSGSSQDGSSLPSPPSPAPSAAAAGAGGSAALRAMGSQSWAAALPGALGALLSTCSTFLVACWRVLPQFQGPPLPQALQRMGLVLAVSLVMVVVLCTIDSAWLFCYLLRARRLAP